MRGLDRAIGRHVVEDQPHVLGADVERVGVERGVEEVAGLGLATDLHVEHPQADPAIGAVPGSASIDRRNARSAAWYFRRSAQALGQGGVERGGPGVVRQHERLDRLSPQRIDQEPGGGGEPGQAVLVAGVLGDGFLRVVAGVEEAFVGDVQVGQKDLRGGHPGVDLQRPVGLLPAVGKLVSLQISLPQRDDHLGGGRVDPEGLGQVFPGVPFLVIGQEEPAFEPVGLPAVGVALDGRLVDLVDDVVRLVAEFLAPERGLRVALGGLADKEERRRVGEQIIPVGVVVVDEPLERGDRRFALTSGVEEPRLNPPAEEVVGVDLEGSFGRGLRAVPVASGELDVGQAGPDVGVIGLVILRLGDLAEDSHRLVGLAGAVQGVGPAQRDGVADGRGEIGLFGQGVEGFERLRILADLPQVAGLLDLDRPGRAGDLREDTQHRRQQEQAPHADLLGSVFFQGNRAAAPGNRTRDGLFPNSPSATGAGSPPGERWRRRARRSPPA